MGYNIIDIIDKLIILKKKVKEVYMEMQNPNENDYKMIIIYNTLIKYEDRQIMYYNDLKKDLENKDLDEINFGIYDNISFLIDKYKNSIFFMKSDKKDVYEILKLALKYENEIQGLVIDIQGRLVKKNEDTETITYSVLSQIIKREYDYVEDLKKMLQNY